MYKTIDLCMKNLHTHPYTPTHTCAYFRDTRSDEQLRAQERMFLFLSANERHVSISLDLFLFSSWSLGISFVLNVMMMKCIWHSHESWHLVQSASHLTPRESTKRTVKNIFLPFSCTNIRGAVKLRTISLLISYIPFISVNVTGRIKLIRNKKNYIQNDIQSKQENTDVYSTHITLLQSQMISTAISVIQLHVFLSKLLITITFVL